MQINTRPYGPMEIEEDRIITFEQGLPGFESYHKFVVLYNDEKEEVLVWLQSLEEKNLAFVIVDPRVCKPDYAPEVDVKELADIDFEVGQEAALAVYAIVVIPEDVKKMTANLKAPIIINLQSKKAKQIILQEDTYGIKEPVFQAK